MKSKLILILTILELVSLHLFGQQVISSAGGQGKGTTIELSWTIGEPVIETFSNGNTILTQGFNQSNLKVTAIDEISLSGFKLQVYPNPVSLKLNLEVMKGDQENLSYELFSSDGRLISRSLFNVLPGQINMETYSSGSYLLKISDKKGKLIQKFKVVKN